MYTLRNRTATVQLAKDLSFLEFSRGELKFRAPSPFQLEWTDRRIDLSQTARFHVGMDGDRIDVSFSRPLFPARFPGNSYSRPDARYAPHLQMRFTLTLDGDTLAVEISRVRNLPTGGVRLMFAQEFFHFSSDEKAQLVLPLAYGAQFDFPRQDYFSHHFAAMCPWTLPAFALFREQGGIVQWCESPDLEYQLSINAKALHASSLECGILRDDLANRSCRIRFDLLPPGSDFRALARLCRERLQREGVFKTIRQKIAENPEVGVLPGTVFWKHNVYYNKRPAGVKQDYSLYVSKPNWNENEQFPNNWTADEIFGTAKSRGFDRVCVMNTGWNRDGYDAGYPDRLPPNPERGTVREIRDAVRKAKAQSSGYILSVHDNYIDAYDGPACHPGEMVQPIAGVPQRFGVWRGGLTYRICSREALKYAKRDMPKIVKLIGRGAIYLDVMGFIPPSQCRSPLHPQSRTDDINSRRKVFQLAKKIFGALATEGCGTWRFADLIDIGAYGTLQFMQGLPQTDPYPRSIPLWQMVYHDSVLNYFGEGYAGVHGSEYRLYQALYALLPTQFDEHSKRLSFALREAYASAMTDFEEPVPLTVRRMADGSFETDGVARSVFADGTEVVANFTKKAYVRNGHSIPPRDYLIRKR